MPLYPLLDGQGATFDPLKFNWLGTPSFEVAIASVWHKTPVNSWQETRTHEITMGSSGVNSTPSFYGRLLNETLGMKQKIIVGYESQTHAFLAMERGEIDGYPSVFYNSLMSTRPTWLRDKQIKLLVQYGLEKEPAIPDVPFALDLVSNPDDRLMMVAAFAPLQAGRPFVMPPGVPADRVAALRKAFVVALNDKALRDEAAKMQLDVDPMPGDELQTLVASLYATPPHLVERARQALSAKTSPAKPSAKP
jgi:tripartite-type tricarboxylate transporter receptor subunit TctC